jgi:hypothetical protein
MASRQEPIMRFARLQRQREEYKIKLAAQAKEETQISEVRAICMGFRVSTNPGTEIL